MILGKVTGTITSNTDSVGVAGSKFLLIDKCNSNGVTKNDFVVALDLVGAGQNEIVMVSEGSTARETQCTANKPVDAVIVGIIDMIDEQDKIVYKK